MKRRVFLRTTLAGTTAVVVTPSAFLASCSPGGDQDALDKALFGQVNHLQVLDPIWVDSPVLPTLEIKNAIGATLKASQNFVSLIGINPTTCFGFNDAIWGPTLKIGSGETLSIDFTNDLGDDMNIHWNGMMVPAEQDGNPLNVIPAGGSKDFNFTVENRAGLYWYNSVVAGYSGRHLHLGLGGLVWVTDAEETGLPLPNSEREIHLVIQDKNFNESNTLSYGPNTAERMGGFYGANVFVNGVWGPVKEVSTRIYRMRICNASNARILNLGWSDDTIKFYIIGTDGGLRASTGGAIPTIMLAPGERVDTLVDFSEAPLDAEYILSSKQFSNGGVQGNEGFDLMKVIVASNADEPLSIPDDLSTYITLTEGDVTGGTWNMNISNANINEEQAIQDPDHIHGIGGDSFEAGTVNYTVNANTVEKWIFDNTNGKEPRAMHIQGVQFQAITREGGRNELKNWEKGWKDTVLCMPGEKVTVIVPFGSNTGKFVVYATNMENADSGLMNIFEVV